MEVVDIRKKTFQSESLMERTEHIERYISVLRTQLQNLKLFTNLKTVRNIRVFMENHIFVLWDFISLCACECEYDYKKWEEYLPVAKQSLQRGVSLCNATNYLIENEKSFA